MTDERKDRETVRQAARNRKGLDGPDAQALEDALQQTEKEIAKLRERVRDLEREIGQRREYEREANAKYNALREAVREVIAIHGGEIDHNTIHKFAAALERCYKLAVDTCPECDGKGYQNGDHHDACPYCEGRGHGYADDDGNEGES